MAISQRQYNKLLAQETLRYLLMGKLPNLDQIAARVASIVGDSVITYQYIAQPSRDIFQNHTYNKSLRRIKFDIDTLHEEILDLIGKSSERMSYADLFHKVNSYELSNLESKLNSLLFTIENADFYFLGAYESFTDNSKTDTKNSTSSIIDLSESCIALPYGGKNTQKIKTSHLYDSATWPVEVLTPNASSIIGTTNVAGSSFGNIFSDTISSWAYEVVTDVPTDVSIRIVFPLAGSAREEVEVLVNRFELMSHTPTVQTVLLKTSNDNVNYIAPLGYESGVTMRDQKLVYGLDFETTLVQYVELTFSKSTPDKEIVENSGKKYQYIFGLRNFSAFSVGRLSKGRYQSKPFDFTDEEEKISKVSIDVDSIVPKGCSALYSVALTDKNDNFVSSFVPITPINSTSASTGVPKIAQFNTTLPNTSRYSVPFGGNDAAQVYGRPFQGKNFYRIGNSISPEPIFSSSKLYRGYKAWYRDSTQGFELTKVSDIFVSFEQSDVESVYTIAKESVSATNVAGVVMADLSKPVYYSSSRGHLMKPPAGITNTSTDIKPNYAIYKATLTGPVSRRTSSFTLSNSRSQRLPVSNFLIATGVTSDLPILRNIGGQIYQNNVDYIIVTEEINGRQVPTGEITIPDGSALLDSAGSIITPLPSLEFEYTNDPDVTHKITSIYNTRVVLSNLTITNSDNLEITYRYIPTSPSKIIKASIRVANLPSTSGNKIYYTEGRDYIVNASDGGIQRIPTGSIPANGNVYVEFTFRDAAQGIETFVTWCNITDTAGVQIRFEVNDVTKKNKLIPDTELGEGFYVNTSQGLINLTNAITTPLLGPGWVQFVVRSKNPSANTEFRTNLINQVIQLRDENNKKVFRDNNLYFKEIICFRDPLKEITLNHLKVNTLKSDHSVFAIDSTTTPNTNYLVLNFLPNSTDELYLYGPTDDSDVNSNPASIIEEFLHTWESKLTSNIVGTKVVVRIDLERDTQTDGGVTPKCFEYRLRAGV